jgi:hypothetical protein
VELHSNLQPARRSCSYLTKLLQQMRTSSHNRLDQVRGTGEKNCIKSAYGPPREKPHNKITCKPDLPTHYWARRRTHGADTNTQGLAYNSSCALEIAAQSPYTQSCAVFGLRRLPSQGWMYTTVMDGGPQRLRHAGLLSRTERRPLSSNMSLWTSKSSSHFYLSRRIVARRDDKIHSRTTLGKT